MAGLQAQLRTCHHGFAELGPTPRSCGPNAGRRLARERNSAIFGKRMPAMTGQAAIVVVGAGDQEPSTVAEHLNRRYGAEYDVIVEQSAALGLERLMS